MTESPAAEIDAVLWDNDGVLVDTEPLYLRANQVILARAGIELTEAVYQDLSLRQGASVFALAEQRGFPREQIDAMRADRDALYSELLDAGVDVLDGVRASLDALHGRVRMGIVTSSQPIHFERIHRTTGLLDYFEFVLASGDYDRHKPHPDPYLAGATRMAVRPERCLAIEDTERGLLSAVAAGMRCIVVPRPLSRDGDFRSAHRVLRSSAEIPGVVTTFLAG